MAASNSIFQGSIENVLAIALSTIFLVLFITISCVQESVQKEDLKGRWLLYEATRDGQSTETLRDAFCHFMNDTMMVNNLLREEKEYYYSVKGGIIHQEGALDAEYNIENLTADSLVLSAEISEYKFKFFLLRDSLDLLQ